MAYKIIGRVLQVGTPQTFTSKSGNQFMKRDVVIMVRKFDQYTGEPIFDELNTPKFSFMNEKCQQLDQIKVGTIVTISFDIRGRAYEKDGKTEYINDVSPFRVVPDKSNYQLQQQVYQQAYDQVVHPSVQPQPTYQQSVSTQSQQAYSQPPQETYSGQPYTPPYNGHNAPQMPQNGRPRHEDDLPF